MANEGSTKATYEELERRLKSAKDALFNMQADRETRTGREQRLTAELARLRGLLQRQSDALCGMIATFESGDHADKSSEFGICSTGMCAVCDAQEALDAAMSDIQIPTDAKSDKNPPWIGVEERLPDYQARSIIYLPEGWIGCGWRSELRGGVWLVENCDGVEPYQAGHPTHWMPLPSPPTFPQSSSLVPSGAESADMGKLDAVDKDENVLCAFCPTRSPDHSMKACLKAGKCLYPDKPVGHFALADAESGLEMGKVNRVDETPDKTVPFGCVRAREHLRGEAHDCKAGSAETGGEKAALGNAVLIPRRLWQQLFDFLNRRMERDRWQNDQHRLREGLEDCAEPNRLRGADGCAFCMGSGKRVDDAKDICIPCECVRPARQHRDSFVRELEANFPRSSQNQAASSGVEGAHEGTTADKKHVCGMAGFNMMLGDSCPPCEARLADSREPEKLNNAQNWGISGNISVLPKSMALAESSLSSPPPDCQSNGANNRDE